MATSLVLVHGGGTTGRQWDLVRDRAVPLALQDQMVAHLPGTPTVALDVGHLPMVTMPSVIAALLEGMAAGTAR
jgi:hypothetical protein